MNLGIIVRTFVRRSNFYFSNVRPLKPPRVWVPKTIEGAIKAKEENNDQPQTNEYEKQEQPYEPRNQDNRDDDFQSSSAGPRSYNKKPQVNETQGPPNVQSGYFVQELVEEQKSNKIPPSTKYKSIREASTTNKEFEFKQPTDLQRKSKTGEDQVQKKQIDKNLLLQEYEDLKKQDLKSRKYAEMINLASQLNIDYEIHFKEYIAQNQSFDGQVFSEYFNATISSNLDKNEQFRILKKIVQTDLKNLELRDIVLYYDSIFRTNLLPQQKGIELLDLMSKIMRQDLKIINFDLSHFNSIFNLETYNQFKANYLAPVKAVQEFIEYNFMHASNIKLLPQLDMIFLICREFTQSQGLLNHSDSCLQILISLAKYNILDKIPVKELALWTKNYLKHEKGLKTIVKILNQVKSDQFIGHFENVVRKVEAEQYELNCLKQLRQEYQSLKTPSSVTLEVFCTLAEKANDSKMIIDIFQTYGVHIKNKSQKSPHIYKKVIEVVLSQDITSNNINAVQSLIQDAKSDQSPIPQFCQDMFTIKALIKDNQYSSALSNFRQNIIHSQILGYQRDKIRKLLYGYIQESYGVTTKFDYNPDYLNARSRVDSLILSIQPQSLKKMHLEEQSDNTLLEALTFSEDPFDFWEQTQRINAFYYLRNGILANLVTIEQLMNIDPNDKQAQYKRDALDNYEKYLALEKKSRVQERRDSRFMQVLDSLKLTQFFEKDEEQLVADFNTSISQEFLDKKIFGKMEDEFPELEQVVMMREAIKIKESLQREPHRAKQIKAQELSFDLGQELRSLERRIQDIKVEPKDFLEKDDGEDYDPDVATSSKINDRDIEYPELPQLDSPNAIKEFIQEYYDPTVNQYNLEDISQNPLKPKDKPYGQRFMTLQNLEEMKWRYYHLYNSGFEFMNGQRLEDQYQNQIWDLMIWGVQNNEPMAIKLGEYYSSHVGVTIPKYITKIVAHYYKYDVRQEQANKRFEEAHKVIGPIQFEKVYNDTDTVFAKAVDRDILLKMECTFEFKGHARSLLKTSYSNQRFQRYGVTMTDVLQSIKASQ